MTTDQEIQLRNEPNLNWCLEVIEKELSKHHSPASNMMNIMSHIQFKVNEMQEKQKQEIQELRRRNPYSNADDSLYEMGQHYGYEQACDELEKMRKESGE